MLRKNKMTNSRRTSRGPV